MHGIKKRSPWVSKCFAAWKPHVVVRNGAPLESHSLAIVKTGG